MSAGVAWLPPTREQSDLVGVCVLTGERLTPTQRDALAEVLREVGSTLRVAARSRDRVPPPVDALLNPLAGLYARLVEVLERPR